MRTTTIIGWIVKSAFLSAILLPFSIITVISSFLDPVIAFISHWRERKAVLHNPMHNYGAVQSIRELGTENTWRVYFQKLDREMHMTIVKNQFLDVLIAFLDARGIDTSEIKERGLHILNSGVIVSGGIISAESLAVGQGAQANIAQGSSPDAASFQTGSGMSNARPRKSKEAR